MLHGIKFLNELQDTPIVPRLGVVGRRSFKISYEGSKAKKLREEDIQLIIQSLRKHKIIHRDIIPDNLLWNGKNVVLIDFAWAIHEGEEFDCPEHTGGIYRCPEGFNDEYSLRKIKEEYESLS
jgi:serine/threonine protein kinase